MINKTINYCAILTAGLIWLICAMCVAFGSKLLSLDIFKIANYYIINQEAPLITIIITVDIIIGFLFLNEYHLMARLKTGHNIVWILVIILINFCYLFLNTEKIKPYLSDGIFVFLFLFSFFTLLIYRILTFTRLETPPPNNSYAPHRIQVKNLTQTKAS